jgi:hypothetical protein
MQERKKLEWQNELINFLVVGESSKNLWTMSFEKKCLMIFLRHFGCIFCKNMLATIALEQDFLKKRGYQIVLVHQSDLLVSKEFFKQFAFKQYFEISDPYRNCYKAFNINSARPINLFNLKLIYGAWNSYRQGYKMSKIEGNVWQMPGLLILSEGQILKQYEFSHMGEIPNIKEFAD